MKYRNYWGYEIDLLEATAKILNFSYTIVNPADGKWGHIEADGTWSGLVAEAANGNVDFVICDVFIVYSRAQVIDGTIAFDKDYQVLKGPHFDFIAKWYENVYCFQAFASPQPHPVPKFLALVSPFTPLVWLSLLICVLMVTLTLWLVSNLESSLNEHPLPHWSSLPRSLWYCYGTFIGESITRDTRSASANALRWVLAVWVLYCFILATSYAGNLKAFLTTPEYTKPINTLAEVNVLTLLIAACVNLLNDCSGVGKRPSMEDGTVRRRGRGDDGKERRLCHQNNMGQQDRRGIRTISKGTLHCSTDLQKITL